MKHLAIMAESKKFSNNNKNVSKGHNRPFKGTHSSKSRIN